MIIMADDLLFDYMFLNAQDKEEENERLREENEDLREQLNNRQTSNINYEEEDYDKIRFFAEDVQSIASDCWVEMEVSYEEAEWAIQQWYTPEEYYEYKIWL